MGGASAGGNLPRCSQTVGAHCWGNWEEEGLFLSCGAALFASFRFSNQKGELYSSVWDGLRW